jgi:hypothetical protein
LGALAVQAVTPPFLCQGESVKKSWLGFVICAFVLPAAAQAQSDAAPASAVEKGKMLVAANGSRLGIVYRVTPEGAAQLIIDGRMVAVPANTISAADGKLTTSLTKSQVLALH